MKLQIKQREREELVILDLKGQLVQGEEDLSLLKRLLQLLDSRRREVIINLQEVSNMDASGLATLAFCATRFREGGGRLVLLSPRHRPATDILEPNTDLEGYQEELEAINSFFPSRIAPRYDILEFVQRRRERTTQDPGRVSAEMVFPHNIFGNSSAAK